MTKMIFTFALGLLASAAVSLEYDHAQLTRRDQVAFDQLVAFGDNLSDNGNGSVAHGVAQAGDPDNSIYGFNTWTDGPVMVSYLSDLLGIPLLDYAFGHADGGSKFGATIDNWYTMSTASAPSSKDQIGNYTSSSQLNNVGKAIHLLWIGANDINLFHIGTTTGSDNKDFADTMSRLMAEQVKSLLDAGSKLVVVPNLYPKHISPSKEFYATNEQEYQVLGDAILNANKAIRASLLAFGDQVLYYDVFEFMLGIWNSSSLYGFTHIGDEFCDGYSTLDWNLCVTDGFGSNFYWMQYLDMTTHVHQLIANDLYKSIRARL